MALHAPCWSCQSSHHKRPAPSRCPFLCMKGTGGRGERVRPRVLCAAAVCDFPSGVTADDRLLPHTPKCCEGLPRWGGDEGWPRKKFPSDPYQARPIVQVVKPSLLQPWSQPKWQLFLYTAFLGAALLLPNPRLALRASAAFLLLLQHCHP